jgi:hypothetical protein
MRDHILNVLTKVHTQPIDISVNEIITKLISRLEGLLDDNKKLVEVNNKKLDEVDALKGELKYQI